MKSFRYRSPEFLKEMALYYLKKHKRKMEFRARLEQDTIDALKERGCIVSSADAGGVNTITSSVPFGELVTSEERRTERRELFRAIFLLIFFLGGTRAVYVLALHYGMGLGTALIWLFGWFFLSGMLFPEFDRESKVMPIFLCLLIFAFGFLVHYVGWSNGYS